MGPSPKRHLLSPISLAVSQLDDPALLGVVAASVAWATLSFAALYAGALWAFHSLLHLHGIVAWAVGLLGSVGALFLTLWLFLPVAAAIGTLYFDRIAEAVERRFYPNLGAARGASLAAQIWDGLTVAAKVLGLNLIALLLALLLPGIGLILAWGIAAYAIGRGLFVAVAMRRMPRAIAESLYRSNRVMILAQGSILTFFAYVPVINLLIPVIGVAAMVHVLDMALSAADQVNWSRDKVSS